MPDLPDGWWNRSSDEVAPWVTNRAWALNDAQAGPLLERLVLHHPSLVERTMGNGLRPNAWRRTLDDQGQPLTRPGARTSTLMFLLAHGHAPAVDLALQHGLRTLSAEDCRFPSLALAVVWLSRTRRTTPGDGCDPVARLEREAALLEVLRHHEVQGLPHAQTGTTLTHAARQDAPRAVLDGLQEHGIDPKALQAHHRAVQVTLTALLTAPLLEGGSVATLDRFLSWGLPFSQGPGDDRTALQIVGSYGIARSHPVDPPAAVARRQQILLCTLERHGWVAGPRFRREAFCVAAASAADPSLWPHLSARGADPHSRDPTGNTALHLLGHANTRPEHVQGLLDLCLSPLALNDAGQTPVAALAPRLNGVDSTNGQRQAWQVLERTVLENTLHANGQLLDIPPCSVVRHRL